MKIVTGAILNVTVMLSAAKMVWKRPLSGTLMWRLELSGKLRSTSVFFLLIPKHNCTPSGRIAGDWGAGGN